MEVKTILNQRQREIEQLETASQLKEQENKTQRIWIMSIAGALASLILLSFILVRNNRQKQNANKVFRNHFIQSQIHPSPTHPIRKNGLSR
ncbi:MAG: hypothetical protein U5K79_01550 [Cyclobacteriaceae bacterium]|nr:hypothetical protein [Cyclobacteriaceae bacterium]